jgi:hypothetical protein
MLKSEKIKMSMRRFSKIGYLKMGLLCIWYHILTFFRINNKKINWYFKINYNSNNYNLKK